MGGKENNATDDEGGGQICMNVKTIIIEMCNMTKFVVWTTTEIFYQLMHESPSSTFCGVVITVMDTTKICYNV